MIKGAIRALLLLAMLAPLGAPGTAAARVGSFAGTRGVSVYVQAASGCSVSPCGSRLYVVRYSGVPGSSRCMAPGATPEAIDPTSGAVSQPGSPFGWIAAARPGGDRLLLAQSGGQLSVANADGTGKPQILTGVNPPLGFCMQGSIDGAGQDLAYIAPDAHVHFRRLGVSASDRDLGVTGDDPQFLSASDPQFSPDGKWIAGVVSGGTLGMIHPDGTAFRALTAPGAVTPLYWFPDSRRIAYVGAPLSSCGDSVLILDTQTGARTPVSDGMPTCATGPSSQQFIPQDVAVSPDGTELAIQGAYRQCSPAPGYPPGCPGGELGAPGLFGQARIVIVPATGGSARTIRQLAGSCNDPANVSCVDPAGGAVAPANHVPGFALNTLWWGASGCSTTSRTANAVALAAASVTMLRDGKPIMTPSVCVVAGEPIRLSVRGGKVKVWTIAGLTKFRATTAALGDYIVDNKGDASRAYARLVSRKELGSRALIFYFIRAGSYRVKVKTSSGSAVTTFRVKAPEALVPTITTCEVAFTDDALSGVNLALGSSWIGPGWNAACPPDGRAGLATPIGSGHPGIQWQFPVRADTVSQAGVDETGTVAMIQLLSVHEPNATPPRCVRIVNQADISAFYGSTVTNKAKRQFAFTGLGAGKTITWLNRDSPHLDLAGRVGTWYRSFAARDFLMYLKIPAADGSPRPHTVVMAREGHATR